MATMIPKVIDISSANGPIDFVKVRASGIIGVICLATTGLGPMDQMCKRNRSAARDAGLLIGAYHIGTLDDANAQAVSFFSSVNPDDTTLMALQFDRCPGNQMLLDGARQFLQRMETILGRKAVLCSAAVLNYFYNVDPGPFVDDYLSAHRYWHRQWVDNPTIPGLWDKPWLHNFSGSGVNNDGCYVDGMPPPMGPSIVSMSSYDGSDGQLVLDWAS